MSFLFLHPKSTKPNKWSVSSPTGFERGRGLMSLARLMHKPICDIASLFHFASVQLAPLRSRAGSGNCPATMATKWQPPLKERPPTVKGMSMRMAWRQKKSVVLSGETVHYFHTFVELMDGGEWAIKETRVCHFWLLTVFYSFGNKFRKGIRRMDKPKILYKGYLWNLKK